jgi:hypothetical protein
MTRQTPWFERRFQFDFPTGMFPIIFSRLEALWWQRFQDFQDGRAVLTTADLTNQKTFDANHNERSLDELGNLFLVERQKLLEAIYAFEEPQLALTAIHPRLQQPMRLIDSLYFVAEHDDHHIAIISTLLRKPAS